MIALPISALLGIVVTRLVIDNYGESSYAQYALVVGIGALLPFADLGMGAAIMNATAASRDPRHDDALRLTLVSCIRLLSLSGLVVISVSVVLTAFGVWGDLLGHGLRSRASTVAVALCVAITGVSLMVSVGQRILMGLNRYVWVIVLNAFQTPIVLATLAMMVTFGVGTGVYLAVVAYLATLFLSVAALLLANRLVDPTLGLALQGALRVRRVRGAKVFDTAWPMLIQMVALAIAMQTDRIVLSHVSTVKQLAEYSLAAQMFTPILAVVANATLALWPVFAKARAEGVTSEVSPMRMSALFGCVALVMALGVSLVSGVLSDIASGGRITLGPGLLISFAFLVVFQALKYPLGTYMTDAKGLRYQAYMIMLMLPVNLGLSVVLAQRLGAAGPVIGSAVGVAVFETWGNWAYIRRQHRLRAR